MDQAILTAFLNNTALLLVLSFVYEVTYFVPSRYHRFLPVFKGLLIAFICVAIMSLPFMLQPGVVYDTRSILICVTALIFGSIPTAITVAASAIFRLSIGGAGTLPGIAVIVTSALIGLAWRRWIYPKSTKWRSLSVYAMSITVHITMLACMLLLPYPDSLNIIRKIIVPVLLIYPIASVVLSLILIRQKDIRYVQDKLKQSEEKYRKIADNVSDVIWTTDLSLRTIFVSPSIERMMGETVQAHLNRTLEEKFPPDSLIKIYAIFTEEMENEKNSRCDKNRTRVLELEHYRADGTTIWLAMNVSMLRDENGRLIGFLGVSRDISEIKKVKDELTSSEKKHRLLFETMTQGIVYQSADGSIISANPSAERILGITFDQMRRKTYIDHSLKLIREDCSEWAESEHPVMVALHTGKPCGPFIMGVFKQQTNETVWLSVNAVPVFQLGETVPHQAYMIFQDITNERKAHQNYQLLFNKMLDAFALHEIICDGHGKPIDYKFLIVNPAFERMTGLKSADILGKTVLEVLPDTEPYWIEKYGKVALTGEPIIFNNFSTALGKHYEVSAYQPSPNQFAITFSDTTERIMAENALKESQKKYSSYIENAPLGVFIVNDNGQYVEVNKFASEMTGYDIEQLIKMSIKDITAEESLESAMQSFEKLKSTGYMNEEFKFVHKNGSIRWWNVNSVKLFENRYLGFSMDTTQQKKHEENLIYLSYHDQLTGLFNRRYFEKEIERLNVVSQLPLSVIIGDINGVKLINDAFGHAEGDRLIIETANILQACCSEGDILTRTGGDEFTILMPRTDFETAYKKLLEIQATCNAYNAKISDEAYFINIALGYATKSSVNESFDEVMKTAESYMYHRKLFEHKSSHSSLLESIKATMVAKSQETEEHCERLTVLAKMLGESLDLSQRELDELALLATLHDIGKVGIPESILLKPGKLSEAEWVEMKKHPEIGYRIAMATQELVSIAEYILSHQERWDGKGYPQNLEGDKIPLLSRIIAVVDAYDAMTQDRPYRKAMTHEKALEEIKNNAGKQFDPQIAQRFIKAMSEK